MEAVNDPLTEGQRRVLDYIVQRQAQNGIPPTTREIQKALHLTSQTSVIQFLRALERKGMIRTLPGKARGVVAVPPSPPNTPSRPEGRSLFIDVPIYGEIQAGMPVDAPASTPDILPVHVDSMRLNARSRPFALRVRGDSMVGACIKDGDFAVFDAACEPRPGDIVAALIDGQSTLKRYVMRNGQPYLQAENPTFPELRPLLELTMQGVMAGLVRGGY